MRMMVRDTLTSGGYDVVGQALNGREAVEQYKALRPDVVTMDMVLPEMDGIAAVKAIIAEFPGALIIMCTSIDQPALLVEALKAGARGFITKPFGRSKLIEAISGLSA